MRSTRRLLLLLASLPVVVGSGMLLQPQDAVVGAGAAQPPDNTYRVIRALTNPWSAPCAADVCVTATIARVPLPRVAAARADIVVTATLEYATNSRTAPEIVATVGEVGKMHARLAPGAFLLSRSGGSRTSATLVWGQRATLRADADYDVAIAVRARRLDASTKPLLVRGARVTLVVDVTPA